jgi:hypothetical protein
MLKMSLWVIWLNLAFFLNHVEGKQGTTTLLSLMMLTIVIDHGSNPTNRLVWMLFDLDGKVLGSTHIYDSNDARYGTC